MTTKRYVSIEESELADLRSRVILAEQMRDSFMQQAKDFEELWKLRERRIRRLERRVKDDNKDAARYRWLRNPDQDVSLVLDKQTNFHPADEFGLGGHFDYEYRAGDELDAAIDAAMQKDQSNG